MNKKKYKKFIFEKFELNKARGEFRFYYSLDGEIDFVEKLFVDVKKIDWEKVNPECSGLLSLVLFNLHLILGISYWKTYCPKEIIVNSGKLSKAQAEFWNKLYTNGLGEFFYKNKINFKGLINFPYGTEKLSPIKINTQNRSLVPFGGGRDSIVTAELLKNSKKDFILFSLNTSGVQRETAKVIGKKTIIINRELDKKLFKLNKEGVFNGHIPITAVYSFTSLLAAVLYNYKYIIFSNEQSANYGNVKYLGKIINHQYSKTFEFEIDFYNYLKKFITPSIEYFSLLRPFSELKIASLFSSYQKYFPYFSSCNRNFAINKNSKKTWCGECPKCAFVFSQLSAFTQKKDLIKIFGKNLYEDKKLLNLFLELWGEKSIKPFDCVGTPEEAALAALMALETKEYNKDFIIKYFAENILSKQKDAIIKLKKIWGKNYQHNVHAEFIKMVKHS
jgi:7-cyano-7-deazaguanine synthase in queuosine biosynthesis